MDESTNMRFERGNLFVESLQGDNLERIGREWPYHLIHFGWQCGRENEGENIRESIIEKTCGGNQSCNLHESSQA